MRKKIWFLALIAAFVVSALAGCGGGTGGGSEIDLNVDLANKPALKFLFPNAGESDVTFNSSAPFEYIKQATGYQNVHITQLPAVDIENKINSTFVDKAQYDAIKLTKQQFDNLLSKHVFLDISPALDKFGPNLKQNISKESWDSVTYNGKIYGIPEKNASDSVDLALVFRKDMLKAAGVDAEPTTPEELKSALVALKQHYGANDAQYRPLSFTKDNVIIPAIASAFGVPFNWKDNGAGLDYYAEDPATREYVKFMSELKAADLIDQTSLGNQTMSDCIDKFAKGKVSCIVMGYWNTSEMLGKLKAAGLISGENYEEKTFPYLISYVSALKDSQGNATKWRSSGISYVTVFPYYMNKNAAYAIDWMDKKIETDTFRRMVIGEEGVNYTVDAEGNYLPKNFEPYNYASSYLTGADESNYEKYWLARVKKTLEMHRMWQENMSGADTNGIFDPSTGAPPLIESASKRTSDIVADCKSDIAAMISAGYSDAGYDAMLNAWRTHGGTETKAELNKWWKVK